MSKLKGLDMKNMREDKTLPIHLSKYSQYTKEQFIDIIDDLFDKAGHLTNPKLVFESTIDPYDDCPDDVEVYVQGMRHATEQEIEEDRKRAEIQALSKELGVNFYEAKTILDLQKRGKI